MSENLSKKAKSIKQKLHQLYPDAKCELNYSNARELLVATILSAQCTDVRVNVVTKELFKKYKKPEDYLSKPIKELEGVIRSTGFFRQKAKSIVGAMKIIIEKHQGNVPKTMEELTVLPGVGRKTANVVLGNAFNLPGLPVDTHVTRLSNRLGLSKNHDAVKIESDLCQLLDSEDWCVFSHLLIFHGRRVCTARNPNCSQCSLRGICLFYQSGAKENAK